MRNLRIWVPNTNKIAILMAHQYPVKMNTSQKTALKLDKKKQLSNFGNWHFSPSFDQVYPENCKR